MSFLSEDDAPVAFSNPANQVKSDIVPFSSPNKKPGNKSMAATFLGALAVPGAASGNSGGKTLLGT